MECALFPPGIPQGRKKKLREGSGAKRGSVVKCMGPGGGQIWIQILEPQFPDSIIRFLGTLVLLSAEWQ